MITNISNCGENSQNPNKLVRFIAPLIVFFIVLVGWEAACRLFEVKEFLVPAPSKVAASMRVHAHGLLYDTFITSMESLGGFLLANVLSIIVAILFASSPVARRSFYPYMIALKSVPIIAIAPLMVIWFGYGMIGKVVMSAIISFFPLVVNATRGLTSVDDDALTLMHSLSASRTEIMYKLRFPHAVPYIFSALKISSSLSVVGAIVAELTGATHGLGFTILMASYNVDTPLLFCAIILASGVGLSFFGLVCLIEISAGRKFNRSN